MSDSITTSVLMSVYRGDQPEQLLQALHSTYTNQSVKPDEFVVVVDGPVSYEIEEVLTHFRDEVGGKTVKLLFQSENRGLGAALQIGIAHCSGEYVIRMDADDISVPTRIEKTVHFLEGNSDIDAVGGYIAEFKNEPNDIDSIRMVPLDTDGIREMGKTRNPMNHVTMCIKRESLLAAGGYLPLLFLEDYYLWLRMLASGMKLVNIPEVLVNVRIGNGFIARRNARQQIVGWDYLQKYMLHNGMISHTKALANRIYIRAFVYMPSGFKQAVYKILLRAKRV